MTATLGRLMQLAGLIILPIGFSIGFFRDDARTEVKFLAIGGAIFVLGWLISRKQ